MCVKRTYNRNRCEVQTYLRGAKSPSILKSESVMTSLRAADDAAKSCCKCAMSLCRYTNMRVSVLRASFCSRAAHTVDVIREHGEDV